MVVLSFISMYALMYGMVNSFANVYMNVNQVYMAGLIPRRWGSSSWHSWARCTGIAG